MADGSFFSGIVEGSGFAIGEAVGVVVLVAVATAVGMSRDGLLEFIGTKVYGFFRRRGRPPTQQPERWSLPTWVRLSAWLLVTGLSGFLAWKAFLTPPIVVHDPATREQIAEAAKQLPAPAPQTVVVHDAPSTEDIAKAAKPQIDAIQAQLNTRTAERDSAIAERDAALRQKAPPVQPPAPVILKGGPLGPLTTLDMRAGLGAKPGGAAMGGKPPAPIDFRWAVVMTYPQSNYEFSEIIYRLMVDAHLLVRRLDPPPDHNKVLNAPYLAPSQRQGVTLHGDDLLSKALYGAFSTCMKAAITDKTADGLQEWYVKNGQIAPEQHVIWIEIGEGSPWTMEPQCWK